MRFFLDRARSRIYLQNDKDVEMHCENGSTHFNGEWKSRRSERNERHQQQQQQRQEWCQIQVIMGLRGWML